MKDSTDGILFERVIRRNDNTELDYNVSEILGKLYATTIKTGVILGDQTCLQFHLSI